MNKHLKASHFSPFFFFFLVQNPEKSAEVDGMWNNLFIY